MILKSWTDMIDIDFILEAIGIDFILEQIWH